MGYFFTDPENYCIGDTIKCEQVFTRVVTRSDAPLNALSDDDKTERGSLVKHCEAQCRDVDI